MEHTSTHRTAEQEELVEIPRTFHELHIAAGYHEQEFGAPSRPDHPILGTYACVHHGVEMTVTVRHLDEGPTGGPEFELEWEDGMKVTVLDEDGALMYLARDGAVETVPDEILAVTGPAVAVPVEVVADVPMAEREIPPDSPEHLSKG